MCTGSETMKPISMINKGKKSLIKGPRSWQKPAECYKKTCVIKLISATMIYSTIKSAPCIPSVCSDIFIMMYIWLHSDFNSTEILSQMGAHSHIDIYIRTLNVYRG